MAKRIDYGLYIHAAVGLAIGLLAGYFLPTLPTMAVCVVVSLAGFGREIYQAGSVGNMTWHKVREGLAWSTCWLGLLA